MTRSFDDGVKFTFGCISVAVGFIFACVAAWFHLAPVLVFAAISVAGGTGIVATYAPAPEAPRDP